MKGNILVTEGLEKLLSKMSQMDILKMQVEI